MFFVCFYSLKVLEVFKIMVYNYSVDSILRNYCDFLKEVKNYARRFALSH